MLNSLKTITRGELALAINQIRKNNKNKEKEQPRIEYGYPYIMSIKNTTKKRQVCKLFGFAENFDKPNFGNPEGIIISNINGSDVGYKAMVVELAINPIKVGKWRFESESQLNLKSAMTMFIKTSDGCTQSKPLPLSQLKDPYQYNANILETRRVFTLNVCASLEIPVDGNSEITIMLYPIKSTSEPTKEEIENNIFDQIDEILFVQNNQDEIINATDQVTETIKQEGIAFEETDQVTSNLIDSSTSETLVDGPTPPAEEVVAEKDWGKIFKESGLLDQLNRELKPGDKPKVSVVRISFKKLYDDKSTKKAPAKKATGSSTKATIKPVAKKATTKIIKTIPKEAFKNISVASPDPKGQAKHENALKKAVAKKKAPVVAKKTTTKKKTSSTKK